MRITSDLYVAQLTRRVFADGGFASVGRKGAEAAGAIFIVVRTRDGRVRLYGQIAQAFAADDGTRFFAPVAAADDEALRQRFEREARFDPDFWVVEIETDRPERYLDIRSEGDEPDGQDRLR